MRFVAAFVVCGAVVCAQEAKPASSSDQKHIARLQLMADDVKEALANGNLEKAIQFGDELTDAIIHRDNVLTFVKLEAALPAAGLNRFQELPAVAKAAFEAKDYDKAHAYATELITLAPEYEQERDAFGNAIFYGHMVLGRVALARDKDVKKAKEALIASGRTPGSNTLRSFGPNMSLARDLLAAGERDVVLTSFEQCKAFWNTRALAKTLETWIGTIQGCCRMPNFGPNLFY